MPKRSYSTASGYRYGFNGKENDNDVKGLGNQQDYGMRIYDSRLGRFLSVDPLSVKFPYFSPYHYAGNMPIWAGDLDGLEPEFKHRGDGISGVGLFDQKELGSIRRHQSALRIGIPGKQFQVEWLLANNGEAIGYIASRVVPEEDYKRLYGGSGQGLQQAYVIALDKFSEFGKNSAYYYELSENAELVDVMYGEVDRDPIKSLFDPRYWLLGKIGGLTGKLSSQLFLRIPAIQRSIARAYEFTRLETLSGRQSSKAVGDIMSKMKAGVKMDPIEVFEYDGKKYIIDGHHRVEAANRLGTQVEYRVVTLDDIIKSGRYKSREQILNAAAEASGQKNKLDGKIINSAANK